MSYAVSWIARLGKSTKELISISQRLPTGEQVQIPDEGYYLLRLSTRKPWTLFKQPWTLLITYGSEYLENLESEDARALSINGGETLLFRCFDIVMATQLECFKNGDKVWSITYEGESEEAQLELKGEVPPVTHKILKSLQIKQTSDPQVDFIYELTAELGLHLVGFRHDLSLPGDSPEAFQVLDFESTSGESMPEVPQGPLHQLLRTLVLSGTLSGLRVDKSDDQLVIRASNLEATASKTVNDKIELSIAEEDVTSVYQGSVSECARRIRSVFKPTFPT